VADVEIQRDDTLRRRIHPTQWGTDGVPLSGAFRTAEPSVDLARLRSHPEASQAEAPEQGLAELPASAALDSGLGVQSRPEPYPDDVCVLAGAARCGDDNPSHCVITGKITSGKAKALRDAATVLAAPGSILSPAVPVVGAWVQIVRHRRNLR
jgi:hypothetical protein